MPSRLCWKVGIIWQLGLGRLGRLRFADAEEVWMQPEASPTLDVGASGLMLDTGAEGVTYISLAPVSTIVVSDMANLGGVGVQLGIEVKFLVTREVLTLLSLEIIELFLIVDPCRQVKASQPWFLFSRGLQGWSGLPYLCVRIACSCRWR